MVGFFRTLLLVIVITLILLIHGYKKTQDKKVENFIKTIPKECFLLVHEKNTSKYIRGYYVCDSKPHLLTDGNIRIFAVEIDPETPVKKTTNELRYLDLLRTWVENDLVEIKLVSETIQNNSKKISKKEKKHRQ